jgi:formamidopyrimidine-DNA glycosylase
MPELPEVELAARAVGRTVVGRGIVAAEVRRPKTVLGVSTAEFDTRLRGATFTATGRRGKHILIHLDNSQTLIVHLRMTGRFHYLDAETEFPKHTHAVFYLDNDHRLIFIDPRAFGFIRLVQTDELAQTPELARLAPEPLSDAFTAKSLLGVLSKTNRPIKETLLDQTRVNGLGNIYAAEALFMAGIHPQTPAAAISAARVKKLREAIVSVLRESIEHGSTMNVQNLAEVESNYYGGPYEDHWRVYDREGRPCPRCSQPVKRFTQGGRSTYFCSRCQRR